MRLLGTENLGGRVEKTWLHTGDDGRNKITTQIIEPVGPIFRSAEIRAKTQRSKDFRFKAELPLTVIDDTAKISGKLWGVSTREAFMELMQQKSGRAKSALKMLTEGRDYRKFQAKNYT